MQARKGELDTRHGRLRFARKRKFRNASDAARAMGVKVPTYIAHENGSRDYADDAPRYARKFDTTSDWLLGGAGPAPGEDDLLDGVRTLPPALRGEALNFIEYLKSRKS